MKMFSILSLVMLSLLHAPLAHAQSTKKLSSIYDNLIDLTDSEYGNCASRAQVWSYQLREVEHLNTQKILVIFSQLVHGGPKRNWSFHVAPVIQNKKGEQYVMEKFGQVTAPEAIEPWLKNYSNGTDCLPGANVKDALKWQFKRDENFEMSPQFYGCYYFIVPAEVTDERQLYDFLYQPEMIKSQPLSLELAARGCLLFYTAKSNTYLNMTPQELVDFCRQKIKTPAQ